MRRYVVPLLLALSSAASAQLLPGEQLVQGAMQTLNTSPTMFLNLTGTELFGTVNSAINYTGYFNLSVTNERILAQVEFVGYNNGKPFIRIVGDGVTLWRYDYLNNRYSATVYGTYSGLQPADYSNTFFRYLSAISEGYVSYMTNLLRQVYGASGASYQSWMPGITPFLDVPGNLNYTIGQPPRRTIIFGVGTGALLFVSYDDVSNVGNLKKTVDWDMTILSNLLIDPNEFVFIPPVGARSVAGPRIFGGPAASGGVTALPGH